MFWKGGWERKWTWQPLIRGESFCSSLSWSLILLSYFLALLILHSPWFFFEEIPSYNSACPVGWTGMGDGEKGQTSHWHEEMGWEAKLLGLRISCMLYCLAVCIFISFVNDPHKIYVSLHANYIKRSRVCFTFALYPLSTPWGQGVLFLIPLIAWKTLSPIYPCCLYYTAAEYSLRTQSAAPATVGSSPPVNSRIPSSHKWRKCVKQDSVVQILLEDNGKW